MNSLSAVPNRGPILYHVSIAFIVLSTIFVILRFWSRGVGQKFHYGPDDWLCLLALILSTGLLAMGPLWTRYGFGKHVEDVPPANLETLQKLRFAEAYLYFSSLATVRFSALFFYAGIFGRQSRRFNIAIWFAHGFVAAILLFGILSTTLQCLPIRLAWDKSVTGHCINHTAWYIATTGFDSAVDLLILLMPMPMLLGLQMSKREKFAVFAAFITGYCSLVAAVGGLAEVSAASDKLNTDSTWNAFYLTVWSFIEPPIGIISICTPSLFYLVKQGRNHGIRSLFSTKDAAARKLAAARRGGEDEGKGFAQLHGNSGDSRGLHTQATAKGRRGTLDFDDIDLEHGVNSVEVRKDVVVEHDVRT